MRYAASGPYISYDGVTILAEEARDAAPAGKSATVIIERNRNHFQPHRSTLLADRRVAQEGVVILPDQEAGADWAQIIRGGWSFL